MTHVAISAACGCPYTLSDVSETGPDIDAPAFRYTAESAGRIEATWQQNWNSLGTFNVDRKSVV